MKITILRKVRLIDGDQDYDQEEIIKTKKPVSFSIIRKYDLEGNFKKIIYVQIGNFLEKDFKEIYVDERDFIHVEE